MRDEARDVTLDDYSYKVDGGWYSDGTFRAGDSVFAKDGIENVTLYVLIGDETYESSEISSNRVKSVTPLPEIYGQPVSAEKVPGQNNDGTTSSDPTESGSSQEGEERNPNNLRDWLPLLLIAAGISIAIVAGIAIGVKIAEKKKREKEAEEAEETEEAGDAGDAEASHEGEKEPSEASEDPKD